MRDTKVAQRQEAERRRSNARCGFCVVCAVFSAHSTINKCFTSNVCCRETSFTCVQNRGTDFFPSWLRRIVKAQSERDVFVPQRKPRPRNVVGTAIRSHHRSRAPNGFCSLCGWLARTNEVCDPAQARRDDGCSWSVAYQLGRSRVDKSGRRCPGHPAGRVVLIESTKKAWFCSLTVM